MARSRNIKPGFFLNEDLVELPFEYRLLFAGLWTLVDRDGRMEYRPKKVKMSIFPADNVDIIEGLNSLDKMNLIKIYENKKNKYIQVVNFNRHQNPHKNEKSTNMPAPRGKSSGAKTRAAPDKHGANRADSLLPITDSLSNVSFENLWGNFDSTLGEKGSKKRAEDEFKKLNPDAELIQSMITSLSNQINEKLQKKVTGEFCSPFQHVERWIKNRRWEDEVGLSSTGGGLIL